MATQVNITLTALAHDDEPLPDIPVRRMTLKYGDSEVILGRASLKEPRKDGRGEKKSVSRIADVDNGYMSRNETIASDHAALFLRRDGELCIEHRAGKFPPTFVNGNQITDTIVPVENNDIINLGPLKPYLSKHKNRTYYPFAVRLNFTYDYKVLTGDDHSSSSSSSSSSSDDDDDILPMNTSSQQPKSALSSPTQKHEVIDVSSSDEDASSSSSEETYFHDTILTHPSQQSQNKPKTETVIIDLTENEVEDREQVAAQQSMSTQVAFAEYDSSSDDDDDAHDDKENTGLDDEVDTDEIEDDSIFGDDVSNAPSEEPIERSPVSGPFSRGFRLDYTPEPELFTSDMDIGLGSDDQFDEEEEVDYGKPSSPVIPRQQSQGPHPSISEEFRNFQAADRQRILEEKERKIAEEQRQERQELHDRYMEMERDEGPISAMEKQYEASRNDIQQHIQQHSRAVMMAVAQARDLQQQAQYQEALPRSPELRQPFATEETLGSQLDQSTSSQTENDASAISHEQLAANSQPEFRSSPPLPHPPFQTFDFGTMSTANPLLNGAQMDVFGMEDCFMPPAPRPANVPLPQHTREIWQLSSPYTPEPSEYFAARAENRATMLNTMQQKSSQDQPQQKTPPSLLMSGSLFGQTLESGITLPTVGPHTLRDEYGNLKKEELQIGAQKLWYDEQTKRWVGRHRGKVSIQELLDHVEEAYNEEDEDEDEAAWHNPMQTESLSMKASETAQDADASDAAFETSAAVLAAKRTRREALPKAPLSYVAEHQALMTRLMPEAWSLNARGSEIDVSMERETPDDRPPPSPAGKKRKHVEFEEKDTVIELTTTSANATATTSESPKIAAIRKDVETNWPRLMRGEPLLSMDTDSPWMRAQHARAMATPVRPSLRLRKVLERAAFATVGGVVAAVGVFAALVVSAPEEF